MRTAHHFSSALLAASLAVLAPPPSGAVDDCFDCVLGLWDDPGMTANFGTIVPGQPKDIYLGIDFASPFDRLLVIECSIAGIRQLEDQILLLGAQPIVPASVILGNIPAPADTSATSTGVGGAQFAWDCLQGDQALVRVSLLTFGPQANKVLRVLRKYPPSNPMVRTPNFTQCDDPIYTQTRVRGGCYILNWDGNPDLGCNGETVAVESTTWSGMKALFR